jgi:hypothetical protein
MSACIHTRNVDFCKHFMQLLSTLQNGSHAGVSSAIARCARQVGRESHDGTANVALIAGQRAKEAMALGARGRVRQGEQCNCADVPGAANLWKCLGRMRLRASANRPSGALSRHAVWRE